MKIINENGATLATYVYDAWGALLSQSENGSIAGLSPFRYRSYVYDTDTELYYLQSRYYDPQTGRFINADDTAYIGTTDTALSGNIFAYCENNCVNKFDYMGSFSSISIDSLNVRPYVIRDGNSKKCQIYLSIIGTMYVSEVRFLSFTGTVNGKTRTYLKNIHRWRIYRFSAGRIRSVYIVDISVPIKVKSVYLKFLNLQTYILNFGWFAFGNIYGTYKLN